MSELRTPWCRAMWLIIWGEKLDFFLIPDTEINSRWDQEFKWGKCTRGKEKKTISKLLGRSGLPKCDWGRRLWKGTAAQQEQGRKTRARQTSPVPGVRSPSSGSFRVGGEHLLMWNPTHHMLIEGRHGEDGYTQARAWGRQRRESDAANSTGGS